MINTFVMNTEMIEILKQRTLKRSYQTARVQARYRGIDWHLSWDEFYDLWNENDAWMHKGVTSTALTMTRKDMDGAWELNNVEITTRAEMLSREGAYRREKNGSTN